MTSALGRQSSYRRWPRALSTWKPWQILGCVCVLWFVLPLVARAEQPGYVLLFDKRCPGCRSCLPQTYSHRQLGQATLTLLERQGSAFFVRRSWTANYGMVEGPKGCLGDQRTPEGLYFTEPVRRNRGEDYGYTLIPIDYPNEEDSRDLNSQRGEAPADKCLCQQGGVIRNRQWGMCERVCPNPGVGIAIHGGRLGATQGCIRLLDPSAGTNDKRAIHAKSIAEVADLIAEIPGQRVPLISVPYAAPGCHSDLGEQVSEGCAEALRTILNQSTSVRPSRREVSQLLAHASGLPRRRHGSTAVLRRDAGQPSVPKPDSTPALRPIQIQSVYATSEAVGCGENSDQLCAADGLIAGNSPRVWCEAVPGTGEGQWLRFSLGKAQRIVRVEIKNGDWSKGAGSPRWFQRGYLTSLVFVVNGRITHCSHPQDDATQIDCDLDGTAGSSLLLRIQSAAAGETSEQVCISSVSLLTDEPST